MQWDDIMRAWSVFLSPQEIIPNSEYQIVNCEYDFKF